ncbi:hypothetical protein EV586_10246 [Tumebacillus sp. BK434]|nr:hypothetical protein EV586_10246 [Tumebacillus sp. BK434]
MSKTHTKQRTAVLFSLLAVGAVVFFMIMVPVLLR